MEEGREEPRAWEGGASRGQGSRGLRRVAGLTEALGTDREERGRC